LDNCTRRFGHATYQHHPVTPAVELNFETVDTQQSGKRKTVLPDRTRTGNLVTSLPWTSSYPTISGGAGGAAGGKGSEGDAAGRFRMSPETRKAIEAVRFIAAHLQNEDDYGEILEDWRYIAMVIDRLQLYIFLAVTIGGTVGILINAPDIFDFVDQDEIKRAIISSEAGEVS
jgi:hypothetical protein